MKINQITYGALSALIALTVVACKQETTIIEREIVTSPSTEERPIYTVEGVVNGGGGKGVLCQKDGQPHLEVLDIHEGRYVYGLEYPEFETLDEAYEHYFQKEVGDSDNVEKEIRVVKDLVVNTFRFLPKGYRLKDTQDSLEPYTLLGCEVVQIAVFYDEEIAMVDGNLWEMLSPLNQFALIFHEFIYKTKRDSIGVEDSRSTRRLIAYGLSANFLDSMDKLDYDREYLMCRALKESDLNERFSLLEFYVQADEKEAAKTHFIISEANKIPVYYETSGTVEMGLEELINIDEENWVSVDLKKHTYPNYLGDIQMYRMKDTECQQPNGEPDSETDCPSNQALKFKVFFDEGGLVSKTQRLEVMVQCQLDPGLIE